MRRPLPQTGSIFSAFLDRHNFRVFKNAFSGAFLLLVFLLNFGGFSVVGQNPADPPTYVHLDKYDLPTIFLSLSGLNSDDITIAIATDRQDNVYTLSFGNGVVKRDPDGNVIDNNFITGLSSPLDIAVDSEGLIYIADYFAGGDTYEDNGQIKIYDQQGNYLRSILTSYYRPMGIDVDGNNIYIAEYNSGEEGPERTPASRIRIVDKNTGNVRSINNNVETPYRIAVDSKGNVYVSQAGNNDSAVLIFDENLNYLSRLSNVQSPGSVVIDEFDYVYVAEYAGRVDFSEFVNFENLSFSDAQDIAEAIDNGTEDNAFGIKIFNPNLGFEEFYKSEIDFPVDIAFSDCDRMYVNNALVFGRNYLFIGYIPEKIEFDLEIYQRTPTFDSIEGPEISCPDNIIVTAEPGDDFAEVEFDDAEATDNCSAIVEQTDGLVSGSEFPVGTHTIEFTATDDFGLTATCTFTVTVEPSEDEGEETPPDAVCNDFDVRLDENGVAQITADQVYGGNEDLELSIDIESFNCSDLGENTVVLTVTDRDTQLSDSCEATITVVDERAPVANCAAPFTVELDENGEASITVADIDNNSTDNCEITSRTLSQYNFTRDDLGVVPVTLTITDSSGLTDECTIDITVEDNRPPEAVCNDFDVRLDENGVAQITADQVYGGNEDLDLSIDIKSFDCSDLGDNTVVLTVTDRDTQLSDTCEATITVVDERAPVARCAAPFTVELDENGEASITVADIDNNSTDNCEISSRTLSQYNFTRDDLGVVPVMLTITDSSGLTDECTIDITVEDNRPPEAVCNDFEVRLDENGVAQITADQVYGGNEDLDLSIDIESFDCSDLGDNTVVLTVTDRNTELSDTCEATITVIDNEDPEVSCPENLDFTVAYGEAGRVVEYGLPTFTDNCSAEIEQTEGLPSGSEFPVGTTTNMFEISDEQGNPVTCSFTVTIETENLNPPVFEHCPTDLRNVTTDNGQCGAIVNYTEPTASDENGNVAVQLISGYASGAEFPVGTTEVIFEATNAAGTATCSFDVTVTDNEDPEVSCPEDLDFTVAYGETGKTVEYDLPTFTDNCSAEIEQTEGLPSGSEFPVGTTTNTFVISDEQDNTVTCSFNITIETADPGAPTFDNCPFNINRNNDPGICGAVVNFDTPTASGGAGNLQVSQIEGPASGEIFPVGPTTVTFEVIDENSQSTQCSFKITIIDNEDPEITSCSEDLDFTVAYGKTGRVVEYALPTFTDNCSADILQTEGLPPGSDFPVGITTNTFEISDEQGNAVTCSFTVTIETADPGAPAFDNCPANINRNNDFGICGAVVNFDTPTASGGAGNLQVSQIEGPASGDIFPVGPTTVTFEVIDENSQSTQCSFEITVTDNEDPVSTCPEDIYTDAEIGEDFAVVHFSTLTASDNCSTTMVQTQGLPSGSRFPVGTTTIEFLATDPAGNTATCSFDITVEADDTDPQEITCPEDQTVDLEGECYFIIPDYTYLVTENPEAELNQYPSEGTVVTEDTEISITASLDGETVTCDFKVSLINQRGFEITCPSHRNEVVDANGNFTLPDYIDMATWTTCDAPDITQFPEEGTVINEDTEVTLTLRDADGKETECSFQVNLVETQDPLEISCPADRTVQPESNCEYALPDFRDEAVTNDPEATITQSPQPGTFISENTEVTLTVSRGTETASCAFQLNLKDTTPPVASCVSEFTLHLNEEGYGILSETIINDGSTDNCGIENMFLSQTRFTTADIGEQQITLTVMDAAGNADSCESTITVEPYDEETGGVSCPDSLTLPLSEAGDFVLTLNYSGNSDNEEVEISKTHFSCDDVGTTQTVTATYWGEYTGSCDIAVTVIDDLAPQVNCVSSIDLQLREDGTAAISEEQLGLDASDNCGVDDISFSRMNFTTADIGEQEVTITVTDTSGNTTTCITIVNVTSRGNTDQGLSCVGSVTLELNDEGEAYLSTEDIYNDEGLEPEEMELSQSFFDCSDIGDTQVQLTATYPDGSTQTCTVAVTILDPGNNCTTTPTEPELPEDRPYVIIYPNPGNGLVNVQTSEGIDLRRAEVFDMRGRFLFEKNYYDPMYNSQMNTTLDLRKYQAGVYTIIYYSDEERYIRRAIINPN